MNSLSVSRRPIAADIADGPIESSHYIYTAAPGLVKATENVEILVIELATKLTKRQKKMVKKRTHSASASSSFVAKLQVERTKHKSGILAK